MNEYTKGLLTGAFMGAMIAFGICVILAQFGLLQLSN